MGTLIRHLNFEFDDGQILTVGNSAAERVGGTSTSNPYTGPTYPFDISPTGQEHFISPFVKMSGSYLSMLGFYKLPNPSACNDWATTQIVLTSLDAPDMSI